MQSTAKRFWCDSTISSSVTISGGIQKLFHRLFMKINQGHLYQCEYVSSSGAKKETSRGSHGPPWGRKQQSRRCTNCFQKAPKLLKLPENDLEQLYQKCKNCLPPSGKQLRSTLVSVYSRFEVCSTFPFQKFPRNSLTNSAWLVCYKFWLISIQLSHFKINYHDSKFN